MRGATSNIISSDVLASATHGSTHRAPIDRVQAQARVRVAVRAGTVDRNVMVDENILAALRVREDRLASRGVDVTVRGEHERAARAPEVFAVLVEEGAVRRA